ncbi:MAG: response regulator transcription factor [Verrucomicrobiota bacterium]
MSENSRTIAIVEDDSELRLTLTDLIGNATPWTVRHVFPNAEAALPILSETPVDLVLMDIQLPGMSGIECVSQLKLHQPNTKVLMLTVYDNPERVFEALAAGASGYLLKRDVPNRLLESLDDVMIGNSPISSAVARHVFQHFLAEVPAPPGEDWNLTKRETQILEELVKGSFYKEIAANLGISLETVRFHLHNLYNKLHVRTRTEAVVKYLGH